MPQLYEQDSLYSDIYHYLHEALPVSVIRTALVQDFNENRREHPHPDFDEQDFLAVLDEIDQHSMRDLFFETLMSERPLSAFRQQPNAILHPGVKTTLLDVLDFKLKKTLSQVMDLTPSEMTTLYRQLDAARSYLPKGQEAQGLLMSVGPWRIELVSGKPIKVIHTHHQHPLEGDAIDQIHEAFEAWTSPLTEALHSKKTFSEDWHYDSCP